MAAPTVQAVGSGTGVGNVDLTITLPAHIADDILIAVVETATETVTTATSGWAQVADSPQQTTGVNSRLTVYWKRATSSSETNPVFAGTTNHKYGFAINLRGCDTSGDPWDVTSGGVDNTNNNAISITGDTTTVAECLILYLAARGTDDAGAQYSGEADSTVTSLAEQFDAGTITGNGGGLGAWTGVKATAGAYGPLTATLATNASDAFMSIALAPGTSAATGTIAVTEEADTSAFTGLVTLLGTVAATEGDDTSAIAGLVANPIIGTIAVTEEGDVSAFVGDSTSPPINGSITVVEQDDTATFTGTVIPPAVTGTITATEEDDDAGFAGFSTTPGTMVVTEEDDTAAFTGTVANPVTGTITVTEGDDLSGFVALLSAPGTITTTETDDISNFAGVVANPITGTITAVELDDTATIVGNTTGGVAVPLRVATSTVTSSPVSSTVTVALVESEVQ